MSEGEQCVDVSILVPTHDRSAILARTTLRSLALIAVPAGVSAELVVVANACSDDTADVARAAAGAMPFPVRVVDEPTPGLCRARNRAVAEARGGVLAFLDDDVDVDPRWLGGLMGTFAATGADLVGGRIALWWDGVAPPPWLDPALARAVFAARDHGDGEVELTRAGDAAGANFAFRRAVFESVGPFDERIGRRGDRMTSGDEVEWVTRALAAGHRMFYAPGASVGHLVAPHRLDADHMAEIAYEDAKFGMRLRDPFPPARVARAGAGHLYLALRHGAAEALSRLRGDPRAAFRHRLRRSVGLGGVAGVVARAVRGRASNR